MKDAARHICSREMKEVGFQVVALNVRYKVDLFGCVVPNLLAWDKTNLIPMDNPM